MPSPDESYTGPPNILDHDLNKHFSELLKFESTPEMEASELYKSIRPELERIMNAVVVEPISAPGTVATGAIEIHVTTAPDTDVVRALAWNLERGIRFDGIAEALKTHEQLKDKDILMLPELDYVMARSGNRFVAQELARELK